MDDFEFKDEIEEDLDDDLDDALEEDENAISFESKNEEEDEENNTFENDVDNNKNNLANKKFSLIVIITVSVVCGLIVFFIFYAIFNPRGKVKEVNSNLDLASSTVEELYRNVTYGMNGLRYEKYIKEPSVTLKDFTNYEKYYYALSYVQSNDFQDSGTNTESKTEIYTLSSDKVSNYMRKYFGDDVTYEKRTAIPYTFLEVNKLNKNTGTLKYDDTTRKYSIVFTSQEPRRNQPMMTRKFFAELTKATQVNENEIELVENILYTRCSLNQSKTYSCTLYKDYENTVRIGEKIGVSNDSEINFDDYKGHSKIIYRFKKSSEGNYVFASSKIKYSE